MDYKDKLDRMTEHLAEHPHDYQTVISRLKLASSIYDHEMERKKHARLKRLAEVKRRRHGEEGKCQEIL